MAAPSTGKSGLRSEIFYEFKPQRVLTGEEGKRVADDLRKLNGEIITLQTTITNMVVDATPIVFRRIMLLMGG